MAVVGMIQAIQVSHMFINLLIERVILYSKLCFSLKKKQEAGIPIDMVGGVSIDTFICALW